MQMDIYGIDFTSRPGPRKPLTCARCRFEDGILRQLSESAWPSFEGLDALLQMEGSWIAGIDFPFGQARRFVDNVGWPRTWEDYTAHADSLGRQGFCDELKAYKESRLKGDKEHRRAVDTLAGGVSPQKLFGVPVGLMYFEGAPRLLRSPATIPHLKEGDPLRVIVESYPGVVVRNLTGNNGGYKNDNRHRQTTAQSTKRRKIIECLSVAENPYGFAVHGADGVADDPTGDRLDALLCAVQAAWAWQRRDQGFGAPKNPDPLEGWIADPTVARG
jgi:hypothetical protein